MAEKEVTSDKDLSAGTLSPQQLDLLTVERDEAKQRVAHQSYAFWVGVAFVFAMTLAFLLFANKIVCIIEKNSGLIDWHILLLGSGLIVPPTIIMFALIRRAYPSKANKKEDDELPSAGLLKEITGMVKEVTDMVGVVAKKIGGD